MAPSLKKLILIGTLSLAGFVVFCVGFAYPGYETVRIAVLRDTSRTDLSVQGSYDIIDPKSNRLIESGRTIYRSEVRPRPDGIQIGDHVYRFQHLRIIPRSDLTLWVHDKRRRYRGSMDIHIEPDGELMFVNTLDIERYIKGVLYHEISDQWPLESIEAQAVAVRTYTMYRKQFSEKLPYDLTSDIYSQVYGGKTSERHRTNLGTDRTRGQILMWNEKILPTYYSACCGGHTENVEELWNYKGLKPLSGRVCHFCDFAPHYSWKKNFQSSKVQDELNQEGYEIGLIKEIRVKKRNQSGRIRLLEIEDRDGKVIEITGKDFRQIVGPNIIRSNMYRVEMKGYFFDLVGHGWGHGVGFCQWGAFGMAKQGYRAREILEFYYPGARLATMH